MTLVLAVVALVAALAALAVALLAYRRADDSAARHPQPDRRQVNLGPPRATGERRHRAPDDDRARRRDRDDPQWRTHHEGFPPGHGVPPALRRPTLDDDPTVGTGMPEVHPATRDLRLPPPGSIR